MLDLVARKTAHLVLVIDAILGLGWLLADPNRSRGPVYKPIRDLTNWLPGDPARWWGAIVLILAIAAWLAMRYSSEIRARHIFVFLTGYWAAWSVAYFWGLVTQPHAGIAAFGLSLMAIVGNRRPAIAPQRVSSKGG